MAGTFSRLLYHLVFSTKHRTHFIDPKVRIELYPYTSRVSIRVEDDPCAKAAKTATWQLSTLPSRPDHCRATPTDVVPFF
jgi:hypothetical protein